MQSQSTNLKGKKFGRLKVVHKSDVRPGYWVCKCECGNDTEVSRSALRSGHTASCGCLHRERVTKHGHCSGGKESKEYRAWLDAKARCFNPKKQNYYLYGARGITMCERWKNNFAAFYADLGPCKPGDTLERRDSNGPYDPSNCYWAPQSVQAKNRRTNVFIQHEGKRMITADWARELGIPSSKLARLLRRGLAMDEIIAQVSSRKPLLQLNSRVKARSTTLQ